MTECKIHADSHSFKDWRNDLKGILKKFSTDITSGVLFLYDNQLKNELFLEDINNILNLGEVPNIFTPEEKAEVNSIFLDNDNLMNTKLTIVMVGCGEHEDVGEPIR